MNEVVLKSKTHNLKSTRSFGFTIVELLVVIVIIGILAAITVVSYGGIAQRATVASLISDLDNASKQLKIDQVINGAYPATLAMANGGKGVLASSGTTYQYAVDNSVNPQTFCITATKSAQNYKITNDGTPSIGNCTVTNLITNPSFETNVAGWSAYAGVSAPTRVTTDAWSGNARLAATGNNTNANPRVYYTLPVATGDTISVSVHIRSDGQTPNSLYFVIKTVFGGLETSVPIALSPAWAPDASGWMQVSVTYTVPANVDSLYIQPGVASSTNYTGTLGVDGVIVIKGSPAPNYADGSSAGWVWNGTMNNSTSTGPLL
jgi:prepilin-type N-terminal cleavage/methylation domain-containing protein